MRITAAITPMASHTEAFFIIGEDVVALKNLVLSVLSVDEEKTLLIS